MEALRNDNNKKKGLSTVQNVSEKTVEAILDLYSYELYNLPFKHVLGTADKYTVKTLAHQFFNHCQTVINRY